MIENLEENVHLRVLSLNQNRIKKIQNIDGLQLEELYLSQNQLTKITGLAKLPNLRTLDLSKNQIVLLRGLENIDSLRFLNLSLNKIEKIRQLTYVENLSLLTELDMCFNLIQDKKHYRLQVLFHIPQLRMLDGVEIIAEKKVKAESLHGVDRSDRETIFTSLLPQEKFIDRRLNMIEDLEVESEDPDSEENSGISATLHVTSLINSS